LRLLRIIWLRLLLAVPTLFLVSLGAFALMLLLPGEPARTLAGGDLATPADIARVRDQLGLNDPFFVQYFRWLGGAIHFDFGQSLVNHQPVREAILERMPSTLSIALFAVVTSLVLGLVAGIVAGARPGTVADKISIGMATFGVSIPSFIMAIILIRIFALQWRVFPAVRYVDLGDSFTGWLKSITLPGLSLGLLAAGALSRQLRSGLIDSANSDYVRTAWAVGSDRRRAIGKHALRNSAIPALAVMGSQLTFVMGGTVVIEQLFAIRGVGTYMFQSVNATDLPAIRGVIMWYVLIQVAVYLVVDIALVVLNPKLTVR
jgi:peptide/nickel transport system permease protein